MKMYWWQGGFHLHPESEEERSALKVLTRNLEFIKPGDKARRRAMIYERVGKRDNQQSAIAPDDGWSNSLAERIEYWKKAPLEEDKSMTSMSLFHEKWYRDNVTGKIYRLEGEKQFLEYDPSTDISPGPCQPSS